MSEVEEIRAERDRLMKINEALVRDHNVLLRAKAKADDHEARMAAAIFAAMVVLREAQSVEIEEAVAEALRVLGSAESHANDVNSIGQVLLDLYNAADWVPERIAPDKMFRALVNAKVVLREMGLVGDGA